MTDDKIKLSNHENRIKALENNFYKLDRKIDIIMYSTVGGMFTIIILLTGMIINGG